MGVPKCKKHKKKPKGVPRVTQQVKAETKKFVDSEYNNIATDMTELCGMIYHYALERAFGFTLADDLKLQQETEKVEDEIMQGLLTIEEIQERQTEKGFFFSKKRCQYVELTKAD